MAHEALAPQWVAPYYLIHMLQPGQCACLTREQMEALVRSGHTDVDRLFPISDDMIEEAINEWPLFLDYEVTRLPHNAYTVHLPPGPPARYAISVVTPGTCRKCGCTDVAACVVDGVPCWWVEEPGADGKGLCSGCVT